MEKIIKIFTQLGVDQSIFYQFAVFVVIFILLKYTLFNKLLFVLATREEKTTKRDKDANEKFQKAENLAQQFENEIQKTNEEAQILLSNKKQETLKLEEQKINKAEEQINEDYKQRKAVVVNEVSSKKEVILKSAPALSKDLVNRLV